MSTSWILGFVVGLLIVALIAFIFYTTNGKNLKGTPDERQLAIRGLGYKYAFFATMIAIMAYAVLTHLVDLTMVDPLLGAFTCCAIGIAVYACYCIMKDAYFGLREKESSFIKLMLLVTVINGAVVLVRVLDGSFIEDGKISNVGLNCVCVALFLVILIALVIKKFRTAAEEE